MAFSLSLDPTLVVPRIFLNTSTWNEGPATDTTFNLLDQREIAWRKVMRLTSQILARSRR